MQARTTPCPTLQPAHALVLVLACLAMLAACAFAVPHAHAVEDVKTAILYSDGSLVFQRDAMLDPVKIESGTTVKGTYTGFEEAEAGAVPWAARATSIKTVVFADRISPRNTAYWFNGCSKLTQVYGMANLDTSQAEDMSCMFYGCSKLKALDATHMATGSARDMRFMFANCSALTSLDAHNFDTSKVVNMDYLFAGCAKLKSLNVSGWVNTQATGMDHMFEGCAALATLKLSKFATPAAQGMEALFSGCTALASLDLSGFDTSHVTNMSSLLAGCSKLASVNLAGLDTSQVSTFAAMFAGCSSLASLSVKKLDVSNATNLANMFQGCAALKTLDLTGWNTARASDISYLFAGCDMLASVKLGTLSTAQAYSMRNLFDGCVSLKSLDLSSFDTSQAAKMGNMFRNCSKLETVVLGSAYTFNGRYSTRRDDSGLPSGTWQAQTSSAEYDYDEVPSNVAETYTLYEPGAPEKGMLYVAGAGPSRAVYKVVDAEEMLVRYLRPLLAKDATAATVTTKVTLADDERYKVAYIGAGAFAGWSKLKTLTVKSKLLTPGKAKGSLSGSAVTKVKVATSGTSAAKKKLRAYYKAKVFAKANSGKSVTVS